LRDDQNRPSAAPEPQPPDRGKRRLLSTLLTLLFVVFAGGGLYFGYIFATTALDVLGSSPGGLVQLPPDGAAPQPGVAAAPVAQRTPRPGDEDLTPVAAAPGTADQTPVASPFATIPVDEYRGKNRVTILLLGLDLRGVNRNTPTRSDTMILVTVDPVTKKAGVLSIPRDLWVAIPGHGENKINTAHFFGERDRTGGGPELARQTVELNFGVHVPYWARVDFHGFEELIDAVGGVTVDAQRAIKDDVYPAEDNGIRRVYIPTGLQHLTGAEALRFARSRHSENDFGRGARQRQVLLAARQRVLQPSVIPKIPQLIGIARRSVESNVPLTEYLPLINLARSVSTSDIVSRSVEYSMTLDVHNDGTMLVPKREAIRALIDDVFGITRPATPTPTATPAASTTPQSGAVALRILNGTDQNGLAADWADELRATYRITAVAPAPRRYARTTILDHTNRPGAARDLIETLGLPNVTVEPAEPTPDGADLTLVLGPDLQVP
jgi:LCP family protein required for cell wall assembly